jgi:hypothetical protein
MTRWGSWPEKIADVTLLAHTDRSVVLDLDGQWIAYLFPLQTGQDVSTLARHQPWAKALEGAGALLPVGGQYDEHGDAVVIYSHHAVAELDDVIANPSRVASSVGRLHAALVDHATPNTERRWNDRLKAIEDGLKTTTLWRAPHTKHVVGLPNLHLNLEATVLQDDEMLWIPQPRPLVDHLLAPSERLPGVASMARLEQRLAQMERFATMADRAAFYAGWGAHVPSGWTSPNTVSTVNGGVWIWRYEAILLMLAEARAYGLKGQATQCDRWLLDVSRIQARLGELRTVFATRKGGVYAAVAAAIIGSGPLQWPFVAGSLLVAMAAHALYIKRVPPPY